MWLRSRSSDAGFVLISTSLQERSAGREMQEIKTPFLSLAFCEPAQRSPHAAVQMAVLESAPVLISPVQHHPETPSWQRSGDIRSEAPAI